jgi:hypothetical protein
MGIFKIALLITAVLLIGSNDPTNVKRFSDSNFRYEFSVTEKTVIPRSGTIYYWFKGGAVHHAQSGVGGQLLDGRYTKAYHSNNIAEQGNFKVGLKAGIWKTWHSNGMVATVESYKKGVKNGKFDKFDAKGELIEKGYYKADKKKGRWVNLVLGDTIYYDDGLPVQKQVKMSREEKRLQRMATKEKDSIEKQLKKQFREEEKRNSKAKRVQKKAKKEANAKSKASGNLFERMFDKKQEHDG